MFRAGWKVVGWVEAEGLVTVMLMQFVPPPPTVQQEYTNMMLTMIIRMRVGTRMEETKIKVILKTETRIGSLPEGCPSKISITNPL